MTDERSIAGKRVLFFAPKFFGYEKKMADVMEHLGADVDFFDERSVRRSYEKAALKIAPWIFLIQSSGYYRRIVDRIKDQNYDYIFVVKGEMIPSATLRRLRKMYPEAVFCLYLYDSVRNVPGIKRKFKYFDRILSFDRKDTLRYEGMKFRPLFFSDEFRNTDEKSGTDGKNRDDVFFLGTIHSDRLSVLLRMKAYCARNNLSFRSFCYLPSRYAYYFYKVFNRSFRGAEKSDFTFKKLESGQVAEAVRRSRAVLDVQHPRQTGLTMRTIEMLGMEKKLITTNADIVHYDFYRPENIAIIDREKISIAPDFFSTPFTPLDRETFESYSLREWVLDILCKVGGRYYDR